MTIIGFLVFFVKQLPLTLLVNYFKEPCLLLLEKKLVALFVVLKAIR